MRQSTQAYARSGTYGLKPAVAGGADRADGASSPEAGPRPSARSATRTTRTTARSGPRSIEPSLGAARRVRQGPQGWSAPPLAAPARLRRDQYPTAPFALGGTIPRPAGDTTNQLPSKPCPDACPG